MSGRRNSGDVGSVVLGGRLIIIPQRVVITDLPRVYISDCYKLKRACHLRVTPYAAANPPCIYDTNLYYAGKYLICKRRKRPLNVCFVPFITVALPFRCDKMAQNLFNNAKNLQ